MCLKRFFWQNVAFELKFCWSVIWVADYIFYLLTSESRQKNLWRFLLNIHWILFKNGLNFLRHINQIHKIKSIQICVLNAAKKIQNLPMWICWSWPYICSEQHLTSTTTNFIHTIIKHKKYHFIYKYFYRCKKLNKILILSSITPIILYGYSEYTRFKICVWRVYPLNEIK